MPSVKPSSGRTGGPGVGGRVRRAVPDLLGARLRHLRQVPRLHPADRKPRRDAHPRANAAHHADACPALRPLGLVILGLFATALLSSRRDDHPAISVLSVVEELEVVTPRSQPYVTPIAIAIPAGLVLTQPHGAASVSRIFGPVAPLWFTTLAVLVAAQMARVSRPCCGRR